VTEAGLRRRRRVAGCCGTLVCLLLVAAVADGLQAMMRTGTDRHALLAGERVSVTGPMPPSAGSPEELLVSSSSPDVRLVVDRGFRSFWLGGRMWQGTLEALADAPPGEHQVAVQAAGSADRLLYRVALYRDARERERRSPSLLQRHAGLQPFAAAAALLPVVLAIFFTVFLLSQRLERLMLELGKAEIYMLKKTPAGLQVTFGMGTRQGLSPGMRLEVLDEAGLVIAQARITQCGARDATAVVERGGPVEVGHVAALLRPAAQRADSPT
jgi:hypothetical protein